MKNLAAAAITALILVVAAGCDRLGDQSQMINAGYALNEQTMDDGTRCVVARTSTSVSVDCNFDE
jgi:hypothetical protein